MASPFDQVNMLVMGSPKTPKYKPSEWETDYYNRLKSILEGDSPYLPNKERQYTQMKDKLLPEYERMGKEIDMYSARRGIQGGPTLKRKFDLQDKQLEDLIRLRQEIESQNEQLKLGVLNQMGGLGVGRSQSEYQSDMADFQARLAEYQQMQQNIAGLFGLGGNLLAPQMMPLPSYTPSYTPNYNYNPNFLDTEFNKNYPKYG